MLPILLGKPREQGAVDRLFAHARYDFAGLDATLNNITGEPIHLASGDDHSPTLKRLVDAGHYGVKTGQGFFDWSGRDQKELLQERDLRLLQVRNLMKQWE